MIKVQSMFGMVEIYEKEQNRKVDVRPNMVLKETPKYHYLIKAHDNSGINIVVEKDGNRKVIPVGPGGAASITNIKSKRQMKPNIAQSVIGMIWASWGGPTNKDDVIGNATIGVRG